MATDVRLAVTSKEKRMTTWANIRAIGKWRYVFTFGMSSFGSIMALMMLLQDVYFGRPLVWPAVLIKTAVYIVSGGVWACIMWVLNERAYAKHADRRLETF
jgi:hypothetical protein